MTELKPYQILVKTKCSGFCHTDSMASVSLSLYVGT